MAYGRTQATELVLEHPGRRVAAGVWWFSWQLPALTTGDVAHGESGGDIALGGEPFPGALVRRYTIGVLTSRAVLLLSPHSSGPYTKLAVRRGLFTIH